VMTVDEHLDCVAAKAAGELVVELFGSSFYELDAPARAAYLGEIAEHVRDYLGRELETALGVVRVNQPTPGVWNDQREFDRIVANFQEGT
jgi:hypothetical protein